MLIIPEVRATSNPLWANRTPNEAFETDPGYAEVAMAFTKKVSASSNRWVRVRIVKASPILDLSVRAKWWDDPLWMDKIFWVYNKPIAAVIDGQYYQTYALEFLEAQRVLEDTFRKYNANRFEDPFPALYVPCDCCHLAWSETTNGYSDHLLERPEKALTQQEIDKESAIQEVVKQLEKELVDISDQESWGGEQSVEPFLKKGVNI